MDVATSGGATDLGRRIREHRERAGLTREDAAERAGLADTYVEYLETDPDASPTPGALTALASALGTTKASLAGARMELPPGQQAAEAHPVLEVLDPPECRRLLGTGGVGRFVYVDKRGPAAIPVNYRMLGDDIAFRTSAWGSLAARSLQRRVSFEVDHIDEALGEGWSVLVSGRAHLVTDPEEAAAVTALDIRPWAGGDRETYILLAPAEITGRRIRES